ncbi:AAA family ATPase [Hornefia butyriciproducens]|uniref:AAA family ATPase n=1 Tax=Hornefia butyriciproducens TaxID=2652293 RepID=UPI003F898A95
MRRDELKLINMEDVEVETIDWLWQDFIPYGKITILQGDPGEGKTTVMLRIISGLTTGREILSDDDAPAVNEPANVIYQTAEDGLGDTIKPRLMAAKADCSRVLVIDDSEHALSMRDWRLEEALIETEAKLLVLDPLQAYLGADVNMHRANEVRPVMTELKGLAEKYHCAIVLIGHMNKSSVAKASYRGLGSIDIPAAARSVLYCGRVKDDPDLRVIVPQKASLGYEATPIAFRLSKEQGFQWVGPYDITVDELMTGSSRGRKIEQAKDFLKAALADGPMGSAELKELIKGEGISERTYESARAELGTRAFAKDHKWFTELLVESEDDAVRLQDCKNAEE